MSGIFATLIVWLVWSHIITLAVGFAITWLVGNEIGRRDKDLVRIISVKMIHVLQNRSCWGISTYKRE